MTEFDARLKNARDRLDDVVHVIDRVREDFSDIEADAARWRFVRDRLEKMPKPSWADYGQYVLNILHPVGFTLTMAVDAAIAEREEKE